MEGEGKIVKEDNGCRLVKLSGLFRGRCHPQAGSGRIGGGGGGGAGWRTAVSTGPHCPNSLTIGNGQSFASYLVETELWKPTHSEAGGRARGVLVMKEGNRPDASDVSCQHQKKLGPAFRRYTFIVGAGCPSGIPGHSTIRGKVPMGLTCSSGPVRDEAGKRNDVDPHPLSVNSSDPVLLRLALIAYGFASIRPPAAE